MTVDDAGLVRAVLLRAATTEDTILRLTVSLLACHSKLAQLGAAYEGIYRLPDTADGVRPQRLDRRFECLEGVVRTCPECSKKLPLGALIVHVNDAHH